MTALHLPCIKSLCLSVSVILRHLQALKGDCLHVSALCAIREVHKAEFAQSRAHELCPVQVVSCVQEGGNHAYIVALSPRQYVTRPLPHTHPHTHYPLRQLSCMVGRSLGLHRPAL